MTSIQENIGKHIISCELGIGEIIEVVEMGDMGEFYRVEFKKNQSTNFFSITNQSNYRFLEPKEILEKAIVIFKQENEPLNFDSNKEKIQALKRELKSTKIERLARILSLLSKEDEVHPSLNKSFKSALSSFAQEIEFVFEIKNIDAWHLLGLSKNNK